MPTLPSFQLLCSCCFTLLLALPGFGQGRDTVFAVHKLFREKHGGGAGYAAAADTAFSRQRYARWSDGRPTAQETRQDALASTAFATVGLLKTGRYSPEKEAYIIEAYRLGNPLPADIRGKLHRRHFHRTTKDVAGGH